MYQTISNNISNNPEIDFYIYDNNEAIDMIKTNFKSIVSDTYNRLIPDSYKSDLLRYCLLYINGGIYFDIKFKFTVPIIKLIAKYQSIFVKDFDHCDNATLNGFIITEPRNPIFLDCINQIIYNVSNNVYGENSLFPIGPCLLGSIAKKYNNIFKLKIHKSFNNADNYVITDLYNENDILLIPYSQYRIEQRILQNNDHYSKLYDNKNIYRPS
jgi:mannosyltransferase OCH1-like enzyme